MRRAETIIPNGEEPAGRLTVELSRCGEAVAIGMAAETQMSSSLGLLDHDSAEEIVRRLEACGLPIRAT